ncbi:MAG: ABC transporter ATP-binding protein/permease [Armatimonadota bacterium]|nr:ABC transporter ATP-binding protein/permease [Armatimonadota bacterium]
MNVYKRLFDEIRPHWKLAAGSIGFSIMLAGSELVPSVLTKVLIDQAIFGKNLQLLYLLAAALLTVLLVRTASHYLRMMYTGRLAHLILFELRTRLYEHLQRLSLTFYNNKRTGQIMSRVTSDVNVMEQFVVEGIRDLTVNLLKLAIIATILFVTNPELALLTLLPTLPLAWGTRLFGTHIRARYRTMRRRLADMNAILSDTITGIQVVQVFGQEEQEAEKFRHKSTEFQQAGLASQYLQALFYPSVNFAFGIGQVIVWLVGGREVLNGRLTPGDLVMFSGLVAQFYAPVQVLSQASNLLASTAVSAERVYEILDMQPDIRTEENARPLPEVKGEVIFENVSFGYDSSESVLQDVSLEVKPGEMVGLVGPSGSGKSSLVSLISRFYDVSDGAVKVDGQDVREVDLKDLRRSVSVVPQESYLFHGTIRENIAYGRPQAAFEDVVEAAWAANAHDFIMRLPDAYDTHVGERGAKLSGGERQRIAIARAILDDPKILILDEATSAVDTESEVQIQTALENLMAGRTTLAIAHRLSTVKNADKLVVMEAGRIVEVGTHDELVQREEGLYKRLVEMQSKLNEPLEVPA